MLPNCKPIFPHGLSYEEYGDNWYFRYQLLAINEITQSSQNFEPNQINVKQ
jgi:hypothetical protein